MRCQFFRLSMPLMVNGDIIKAAGYQSGAVRPEYRGRGLYRDLMQRAYAWAEQAGYETGILLTDKPSLYQAYGFSVIPQFKFSGPPPVFKPKSDSNRRQLDVATAEDVGLLRDRLATRQPVSEQFAVVRQIEMFLLNAHFDASVHLTYLAEIDAVVAWTWGNDGCFKLLDIVAREMPHLDTVLSNLAIEPEHVEVYVTPDCLAWQGRPVAYEGSCALMMTGTRFEAREAFAMLSPMADF
nr:GNAT family N-acetyltransferase [Allorhizobium taibaishanense]